MKKLSSVINLIFVGSSLAFLVAGCKKTESSQTQKTGITVSSVEEFKQALASGSKSLLTADLDFNEYFGQDMSNHQLEQSIDVRPLSDEIRRNNSYILTSCIM